MRNTLEQSGEERRGEVEPAIPRRTGQGRFEAILGEIAKADGIGYRAAWWIALLPFFLVGMFSAGIAVPVTRQATLWMIAENRPVELLTFVVLIAGGVRGMVFARSVWNSKRGVTAPIFFFLFSVGLLLIGGEEISWGQQFFGFATPDALKAMNAQGELTFHNVEGLHQFLEVFPLAFGVGGLAGVWSCGLPAFREIGPSRIFIPAFLVIIGISSIDLFHDFVIIHPKLDNLINDLDEVIELLIAITGFLFLSLKARAPGMDLD